MAYRVKYNSNFGELGVHVAQRWPEKNTISNKGKLKHTLGLALSGGGDRAAIFNYGILKEIAYFRGYRKKSRFENGFNFFYELFFKCPAKGF